MKTTPLIVVVIALMTLGGCARKEDLSAILDREAEDLRQIYNFNKKTIQGYPQGTAVIIDYSRYGTFEDIGTADYRFVITDRAGLGRGFTPTRLRPGPMRLI